jgi:hypothetical protein
MIRLNWKTLASIPPRQLSTNSTQPSSIFDYHTSEKLATNLKITAMKLTMKLAIALLATSAFALRNGTHYTDSTFGLVQIAEDFNIKDKDTSAAPKITETPSWAGVVLGPPPENSRYYAVIGSFTVPNPRPAKTFDGQPSKWVGSAWVGIDGWLGQNTLFQAGIDWTVSVEDNGTTSTAYRAWHEWVPDLPTYFPNFVIEPGDTITILCETNSTSYGTCAIQNQNKGVVVQQGFHAPADAGNATKFDLEGKFVEWIVEDQKNGYGPLPFADFGSIEWFDCRAATKDAAGNDTKFSPSDAPQFAVLTWMNVVITNVTTAGNNATIRYIPPQ